VQISQDVRHTPLTGGARFSGGISMGVSITRVARIAALVCGCCAGLSVQALAQDVIADSYIITYRASVSPVGGPNVSALSAGYMERRLGAQAAEIKANNRSAQISSSKISSTAAVTQQAIETFGRKQQDYCNQLVLSREDIASCSPNWVLKISNLPNDSQLQSLWGITGANGVAAPAAWDTTTGSQDVVVAIIDTGIDYTHQDLAANVWVNPFEIAGNRIDDDGNGVIDDVYGANFSGNGRGAGDPYDDNSHGTHVAGTIGAVGNNNLGVVGVNWSIKIMALKFLSANGSGSTSAAILAINYLIDLKSRGINVRVVNNSWGGGGDSPALREAIERADTAGILFTAAAGNSGLNIEETPQYPAAYAVANMLKVAAIDRDGNLASFSNYGLRLVDIAAPGVDILSTVPGNRYASYSGTSMATPHVTGVAALYLSNHPTASVAEVKNAIISGGRDLSSLSGLVLSGRTLDAQRTVTDRVLPVPAPAQECPYAIAEGGVSLDRRADNKKPVITGDEDGFYRVNLPFAFPFEGAYRNSLVLSPNGVAYFSGTPANWDNRNQSAAPANSIAALHTDLYPDPGVARGLGVRVATSDSRVTISWRARIYNRPSAKESVTARLTLYPSGIIEITYQITSPELESALATAAIGVRGLTAASSSTYAGKPSHGLGLRLIPGCAPQVSAGTSVRSISARGVVNSLERTTARAGSRIILRTTVDGTGTVQLIGRIDGKRCPVVNKLTVSARRTNLLGRVPAGIVANRISFALVGDDGRVRNAALRINSHNRVNSAKRASLILNSCNVLMKSFD